MVFFLFFLSSFYFIYKIYFRLKKFLFLKIFSLLIISINLLIFFEFWGFYINSFFFSFNLYIIQFLFFIDFFSIIFLFLLIFIRGFIIYYSFRYFLEEVNQKIFFFYLVFFIFFIFLLVCRRSLLLIFVRWERVGVISFLLISWWFRRSEATQSAIQAILYNRFRDFCFFLSIFSLIFLRYFGELYYFYSYFSFFLIFFFFFSIISKSSQFLFHPWLPNAMERPTPVSSLLHSSTIVVARVFLTIRLFSYFNIYIIILIRIFRSLTILLRALNRVRGKDIKKIIAHSTTSQLRFIILSSVITSQFISFFLLFLHAFFKSCLFLCSGTLIHRIGNNQLVESSLLGFNPNSFTFVIFLLSSISLLGIPFFSRFFSKDLILENIWGRLVNRLISIIFIFRSSLTVCYTLFLFYSSFLYYLFSFSSKFIKIEKFRGFVSWMFFISVRSIFLGGFIINSFFFFIREEFLFFFSKIIPFLVLFLGIFIFFFLIFNTDKGYFFNLLYFNLLFHRSYNFFPLFFIKFYKIFEFKRIEIFFIIFNFNKFFFFDYFNINKIFFFIFFILLFFCFFLA